MEPTALPWLLPGRGLDRTSKRFARWQQLVVGGVSNGRSLEWEESVMHLL